MCIRDSDNGRYIAFYSSASNLVDDDTNGKFDVFVRDIVAGETWRVSVSYTHLRAHETVLDLVCRLLLEKKKNKTEKKKKKIQQRQ